MTKELAGKVAVVTGAGRNIGRAIALTLAEGGASIVVNARSNRAEAEAVAREIESAGGKALVHIGDVADAGAVQAMADARCGDEAIRADRLPRQQRGLAA
jgi:3-oxoacyl-[acyl-carrier protein] reductase